MIDGDIVARYLPLFYAEAQKRRSEPLEFFTSLARSLGARSKINYSFSRVSEDFVSSMPEGRNERRFSASPFSVFVLKNKKIFVYVK